MNANEVEPVSPCVRQCALNENRICVGCGRTADEISSWRSMTVAQKQSCIDSAAARAGLAEMADMADY